MMTRIISALLLLLLLAIPSVPALANSDATGDLSYRVRPGDTLYGIAERGLKSMADYRIVQQRNRIANPRAIPAGSTIKIPRRLLRVVAIPAKVIALRGTVTVDGAPARIDMTVRAGQTIRSAATSFMTMELDDGTVLTLPSSSQMTILRLRKIVLTGTVEKSFKLLDGRVETEVSPLKRKGDSFDIRTPVSQASVRGTQYRVTYREGDGIASTSVVEGSVAVAGAGEMLLLDAGKGVVASETGVGEAEALLSAPGLLNPDRLQDEPQVDFALSPVQHAALYRVQMATDAGFVDLFAEQEADAPTLILNDIPDGSFFARFTAISPGGIEGMPISYTVERRRNDITASVEDASDCPGRRCLRFRWRSNGEGARTYRFQLFDEKDVAAIPLLDEVAMTVSDIVISDLGAGTYYWRVESAGKAGESSFSKWTELEELHVAAVKH